MKFTASGTLVRHPRGTFVHSTERNSMRKCAATGTVCCLFVGVDCYLRALHPGPDAPAYCRE